MSGTSFTEQYEMALLSRSSWLLEQWAKTEAEIARLNKTELSIGAAHSLLSSVTIEDRSYNVKAESKRVT